MNSTKWISFLFTLLAAGLVNSQNLSKKIKLYNKNNNNNNVAIDYFDDETKIASERIRPKRYAVTKNKWPYRTLKWRLHNNELKPSDRFIIRNTLHRAFDLWSSVSSFRFIEVSPIEGEESEENSRLVPADINVLFARGTHGDSFDFDGRGGVVAHAGIGYGIPNTGMLHFDADENWTLNQPKGINFYQTAVHEIGHLLGLGHSSEPRAVMFPRNKRYAVDFELGDDDVRAIRNLYSLSKKN